MKMSAPVLALMTFITFLLMIFFGSVIVYAEGGTYTVNDAFPHGAYLRTNPVTTLDEITPFSSVPIGIYWTILMLTTTGPGGDLVPYTDGGRIISCMVVLIGIVCIAIPLGVIAQNFSFQFKIHERERREKMLKRSQELHEMQQRRKSLEEKSPGNAKVYIAPADSGHGSLENPVPQPNVNASIVGTLSPEKVAALIHRLEKQQDEISALLKELKH